MCHICNQSHCNSCGQQPCIPQTPCTDCEVKDLSTDCIIYTGDTLACSGIETNTPLTETIQQLDEHICEAISQINSSINLENVGNGEELYKGISGTGKRQIRTLISTDDSVVITESIDGNELDFRAKTYLQEGNNITIEGEGTEEDPYIINADNSDQLIIVEGDNIEITGVGTILDPLTINAIIPDSVSPCFSSPKNTIVIGEDGEGCVTLDTTSPCITSDNSTIDVEIDTETNCVNLEVVNLQKEITGDYTLQASDHLHTIFIDNTGRTTITIPLTGLPDNFAVGFYHIGSTGFTIGFTGVVGVTVRLPNGFTNQLNQGGNFSCMIERRLATQEYLLNGDLIPV